MKISSEIKLLMEKASIKRDKTWGKDVTYSRKVFIPLNTKKQS